MVDGQTAVVQILRVFVRREPDLRLRPGRWSEAMSTSSVVLKPRTDGAIDWLLDGDPAIRWQTLRDLVGAAQSTVERERRRVARDGWGARLLARQGPEGAWAGGQSSDDGLYHPKWISTTYTMLLLRDFGLPVNNPRARRACTLLLGRRLQRDGGINYGVWGTGRSETCITGMVLSILSYFAHDDDRLDTVADHLLEQQMPDGGWNCRRWRTLIGPAVCGPLRGPWRRAKPRRAPGATTWAALA